MPYLFMDTVGGARKQHALGVHHATAVNGNQGVSVAAALLAGRGRRKKRGGSK